ncbi:hypothetical protein COOONC_24213, partial [Cooperia oncophora]
MKLWAYCDNDKTQTKIGMRDDIASFYYIHTYNEIKRHIPVKSEPGKTRTFSMCSGDDSETFAMPPIKSETPAKHHTPGDSNG